METKVSGKWYGIYSLQCFDWFDSSSIYIKITNFLFN